jgi:phosphate transport system protein
VDNVTDFPAPAIPPDHPLVNMTREACALATEAVSAAAAAITLRKPELFAKVRACEAKLDAIDREFDDEIVYAVTGTTVAEGRELLCAFKFIIDLERIGDLVSSFGSRAEAVIANVEAQDTDRLIHMLTVLEQMLRLSWDAFEKRELELAIKVLRADGEIDRLRNLVFLRHVGEQRDQELHESVQVLFMAHAIERAGDHAKNLAEEVCHFVSGRTVRHVLKSQDKPFEQLFLDWLRERRSGSL